MVRRDTAAALSRFEARRQVNKEKVMNIKAIIASLVLGSSSIAMASPSVTFSANAQAPYGTTVVRDHRADDWNRPAPIVVQPVAPAASNIHFRNGWHRDPMPPVYRPVT